MRKKSNAFLALLLTGAVTVTSVSPAFAAEEFSADADVQAAWDVTEDEPAAEASDVQDVEEFGEAGDVEDVFTSGEEVSDSDTVDESVELTDGDTEEYVEDDLLLADSSEEKYQDGTYTPESFTFQGGSGKATITCPKVTVTRGKATGTIVFSSSSYTKLVVDGDEYLPITGTEYTGSVFEVPVVLNQDMQITGTTVAMTAAHDITYTIHIKLDIPMVTPAPDRLEDGTYEAAVKADSGFPAEACTLLVKDGEIDAVVTLKNGDYDRLYVGDALDAVNEKDDKLIAYRPSDDGSKHIFWPLAVDKLDTLFQVAARKTDKTWTDHYVKILSSSVTKVSDEVLAPDQAAEAAKFLYRNYVDDVISTTNGVTKDGSSYNVAYYNSYKSTVSSIILKRPDVKTYKSGWFFSDWGIFKSTVKQEPATILTRGYALDMTKRTQEQQVTATLKLYDPSVEDVAINDDSAQALAEYTYNLVLAAKPDTCQVTFRAVNSKTGEVIPDAQITVKDNTTKEDVTGTDGSYELKAGQKYTVQAQCDGYIAVGTKGVKTASATFTAAFDETYDLSLTADADSKHKVTFKVVDADGNVVPDAVLTVTGETPAEDGSYTLWDNCTYFYGVTAEGYQVVKSKIIKPLEDQEVLVTLTALKNYQATIKVRAKSGHLAVVNPKVVSVTYKKNGETLTLDPSEDGTYPMVETVAYTYTYDADNYQSASATWTATGTEGPVELEGVLSNETMKALLEDAIATAKTLYEEMTEGDGAGQWEAGSKETLDAAIKAAEEVYANEEATDTEYKTAKDTLLSAVSSVSQKENAESINITVIVNKAPGEAPVKMSMKVTAEDAQSVTLPSNRKDNYSKESDLGKRATVIDALVDLHKELFGEDYLANPVNYLMCGLKGAGTGYLLGQKSFNNFVGFRVNGKYVANDPRMCRLKDGDVLSVFSATATANPAYLQFEQQEITANQNEEFTLTLTADSYYMDSDIGRTVGKNEFTPAEGYDITLANAETGEEVTGEAKTDAQGKVSFKVATPGTYVVKTVANENVESIVLPYAQIQVKEVAKPPVTLEDGTYLVKVINNNKMFNVINNSCVLKVENGKMTAELSLHGKGYDYMYAGTKEEAEAAGESAWSHYYEKEVVETSTGDKGPWYTYSLAISALDQEIVLSNRNIRDSKWFDRPLTFLTEGIQKIDTPQPTPTATPTVEPTVAPQPTAAPQPTEAPKPETVAARKLTVNTSTMYLKVKKSDTIGVIVTPSNTTDKVTYKSSKKSVATVDKNGKVTAKKAGKAVITVKAGKLTKKVTVVVGKSAAKVTKLKFAKKTLTLKKGSVQFLKVTVNPKKATTDLKWKTSNKKIVTVDKNGKITAKKAGTAKITVSADGKTVSIKIKVKSK